MSEDKRRFTLDRSFWTVTIALGLISAVLMALVKFMPLDRVLPEAADSAQSIDYLFKFMTFFSIPIMVYVYGFALYFIFRYRRRHDQPMTDVGSGIHDHKGLEFWWTMVPAVLMLTLGILSYLEIPKYYQAKAGAVTLEAIGHKWFYEFRYPGLKNSVYNELHLPVGVPVTIDVTAAEANERDAVIHSFWVPEFRVKQDMVPGLVVPLTFTPIRQGTYPLVCTEFCGVGHSAMRAAVVIQSRSDFDAWYKKTAAASGHPTVALSAGNAAGGQQIFAQKCTACHNAAPFDQRKVGPGLGNLFHDPAHPKLVDGKPANAKDVAEIISQGFRGDMGMMPNMQANGLSAKDVANLIAYLQTLHK
ncbi:MAG: cytochrome c oxidase subunit II [Candidatus Eremiobacteraeota bacterium]|nr:cytochrome c oxidase subunit II [Candidatus Eremiobacteraeota bacterium]